MVERVSENPSNMASEQSAAANVTAERRQLWRTPAIVTVALIVLCVEVDKNPATRNHLWILLGMILAAFGIELIYRGITGREIHLVKMKKEGGSSMATT